MPISGEVGGNRKKKIVYNRLGGNTEGERGINMKGKYESKCRSNTTVSKRYLKLCEWKCSQVVGDRFLGERLHKKESDNFSFF